MIDLHDACRALEVVPGLAATKKEWQLRAGAGFPLIESALQPVGGIAECMPCFSRQLGLHYHDVIEHRDGTAEAVLRDEFYDCPSFPVERYERAILKPDMNLLAQNISMVLGFEHAPSVDSCADDYYEIARHHPVEGFSFPVMLSLSPTTVTSEESLLCSAAFNNGPFIFLTGTPKPMRNKVEAMVTVRGILVMPLSESLALSDDGHLAVTPVWERSLAQFHRKNVPEPQPVLAFFPTPPRTRWTDITIRFTDHHTVAVTAGEATGRYSYIEMGMSNRRESSPSKQWLFLEQIAENHRFIDFGMGDASKNKSWKYELSARLRNFFRIDDDPFWPYDPKTNSWEAKFSITPVGGG